MAEDAAISDDAAFEFGFSGKAPEPAEATPAAEATPPDGTVAPTEPTLDPAVKAYVDSVYGGQFKTLQDALASTTHRLRSAEGRVGSLQNALKEFEGFKSRMAALPEPAPALPKVELTGRAAEVAQEHPEWAEALQQMVQQMVPSAAQVVSAPAAQAEPEIGQVPNAAETVVDLAHPGWKNLVSGPEFRVWQEAQPDHIKALGASDDPNAAIAMIGLYKASRPAAPPTPQAPAPAPMSTAKKVATVAAGSGAAGRTAVSLSDEDAFMAGFKSVRR